MIEKPIFSRFGAEFAPGLLIERQSISDANLPLIVETLQLARFLPGPAERGQKHRREDGDDGDDYQ